MNRLKNFFKTSVVYFIGNVFTRMISFLLLPLYTNKIEPQDYGEYGLVMTILQLIIPLVYLSIWDGTFRSAFEIDVKEKRHAIINNGTVVLVVSTIIFIILSLLFGKIFRIHNIEYIIPTGIMMAVQYFYSCNVRALEDTRFFILSGCINSLIMISSNTILIGRFNRGIEVVYLSYIVGTVVQVIILEIKDKLISSFRVNDIKKEIIINCSKFSIPVAINVIILWFLLGFTQYIISSKLGTYYNGQFNVVNKFSAIVTLLINVIQFAWYEMAYDLSNDKEEATKYYTRMLNYMVHALYFIYPFIIFAVKMIYPFFIGKKYQESLILLPALILGTIFSSYSGFVGTIFMSYKTTSKLVVSIVVAGIFNVVMTYLTIDDYGIIGAVIIFCIANFLNVMIRVMQLIRSTEIRISINLIQIMITILSTIIFYLLDFSGLIITAVLLLGFIVFIYRKQLKIICSIINELRRK